MRDTADGRIIEWMDAQAVEMHFLSAITVAELRFAVAVLPGGKRRDMGNVERAGIVLLLEQGRSTPPIAMILPLV